jgi:DNA replication protein DnaC
MDHASNPLGLVAADLAEGRAKDRERLVAASRDAGGPVALLGDIAPLVGRSAPRSLTESELASEPTGWYTDAERRLSLCGRCPPFGGACATDESSLRVGRLPMWVGARLEAKPCEKWREYRIRQRLSSSGVPPLYLDSTFKDFPRELVSDEFQKIVDFRQHLTSGAPSSLILAGGPDSGKTRLSIAMLRGLVTTAPRALLWYTDVTSSRALMKTRYDSDESMGDPFENARLADVVVVDGITVPKERNREEWLHERVEGLIRERLLDARATILTTSDVSSLVTSYQTVDLRGVPVCNLP